MGLFDKKSIPRFSSRADAFAYMLGVQLEKGREPMEAAKTADEFATVFVRNMGLPSAIEPPKEGVDKYMEIADKVMDYCEKHPMAVDMVTGVATFVLGAFAGKTIEKNSQEVKVEPIDFDKID